ncbi:hypothetical protein [Shimia biformata]|uniref:hypothetical protein n=1 Tax=Shimia biformata TaxID=1294299 RepID=UPI00194F5538|nr:hypothetical protein [Shimia biformata]
MILSIWLCAAISASAFALHTFVGGPQVTPPLLRNATLTALSKWLSFYCWHITTVLLFFMAAGFGWLALNPDLPSLVFLTALSAALSVLSFVVERMGGIPPLRLPSTSLFALIAGAGVSAILLA